MSTIVVMPGGFHPFHAGHMSLYNSALKAFPDAEVFVAATNDTKTRPFPFAIKEKLAKVAGVAPGHFVQVKSPFQPREITSQYDPEKDVLIFVRSEKDKNESPTPGGTKKDGSPSYLQPYTKGQLQPFAKHAYMAYLPTVEFGPGITSATEIRNAWPKLDDRRKTAMVMSLYPATQKNSKLAANVVKMLDMAMGEQVAEDISRRGLLKGLAGAGALGAASKASAIAGAFPTPSHQQAMYAAAAQSNRAQAAELQRQNNAARAARLDTATKDIERLNKINYHGGKVTPINATWDGDSDFLDLDGTKYNMAARMPIRGDEPNDMKLISTREGRQVYIWTRKSLKGTHGRYFYPASVNEGFGLPMPTTYEQERGIREPSRKQRITAMTNEEHDLDPEMKAIYQKAIQHYPNAKDKQEAFVKYVQRALMHSEVDDAEQDQRIEVLDKEVDQLQKQVKVSESADYLDEK